MQIHKNAQIVHIHALNFIHLPYSKGMFFQSLEQKLSNCLCLCIHFPFLFFFPQISLPLKATPPFLKIVLMVFYMIILHVYARKKKNYHWIMFWKIVFYCRISKLCWISNDAFPSQKHTDTHTPMYRPLWLLRKSHHMKEIPFLCLFSLHIWQMSQLQFYSCFTP